MPVDVTATVPVCGIAAEVLHTCLESLCVQDFPTLEILVIDDNGSEKAQKECRGTVQSFIRQHKGNAHAKHITYICQGANMGLVEARRTGAERANGSHLLMVDADDTLVSPEAVSRLYRAAVTMPDGTGFPSPGFDVVQCGSVLTGTDSAAVAERSKTMAPVLQPEVRTVNADGSLEGLFFGNSPISRFLWAKLYRTEVALEGFSHVPSMYCVMNEDLLLSYFLSREMHSYRRIADRLYGYSVNTGITSDTAITDLTRWRRFCSSSDVFTALFYDLQERPLPPESAVVKELESLYFSCITKNAWRLLHTVDAKIRPEAREIFIESWGEATALKALEAAQKQ